MTVIWIKNLKVLSKTGSQLWSKTVFRHGWNFWQLKIRKTRLGSRALTRPRWSAGEKQATPAKNPFSIFYSKCRGSTGTCEAKMLKFQNKDFLIWQFSKAEFCLEAEKFHPCSVFSSLNPTLTGKSMWVTRSAHTRRTKSLSMLETVQPIVSTPYTAQTQVCIVPQLQHMLNNLHLCKSWFLLLKGTGA